ncbi:hypothetical protein HYS84_01225 [Candidatus Saccharibacteria bacterium]|nr:hypothetical protein [Candidatus Saccharibacteria bacterium]
MKKLLKILSAALVSAGLTTGFAAAQSGSIDTTGPDSENKVKIEQKNEAKIDNDNDVKVKNKNYQSADSGDAKVKHNTTGGDATSGNSSNSNSASSDVSVSNSGGGTWSLTPPASDADGSISNTGPDSKNEVKITTTNKLKIDNDNDVKVKNDNYQTATSGDATVKDNTTAGDATSGDASNDNTVSNSVNINN